MADENGPDWESRWRSGQTGWDQGASPPVLTEVLKRGLLPEGRTLVPGCGAGYDVLTLAEDGSREVEGLEISPTAIARFESLRERSGLPPSRARVTAADFFSFAPGEGFTLIWDYTFLCAIPPSRREEWARRVDALLRSGAEAVLATLLFPVWPDVRPTLEAPGEGPPYALHPDHARELLQPVGFEPFLLEPVPTDQSHPARAGKEWIGLWRRVTR